MRRKFSNVQVKISQKMMKTWSQTELVSKTMSQEQEPRQIVLGSRKPRTAVEIPHWDQQARQDICIDPRRTIRRPPHHRAGPRAHLPPDTERDQAEQAWDPAYSRAGTRP
jgi:hypothetical protein